MEWINSDFKIIQNLREELTPEIIDKLESLHIHTLEDFLVLWEMDDVKDLLASNVGLDLAEMDKLVGISRRKSELSSDNMFCNPIEQAQLDMCQFGLLEPEESILSSSEQEPTTDQDAKIFHAELEISEINHIEGLKKIQHQGARGACVGFGTAAVREFLCGQNGEKLSEQFLYWGAKQRDGDENSSGTRISCAIKCLEEQGICEDATWRYNPERGETEHQGPPPAKAEREALEYKIIKGVPVTAKSVDSMRALLAGTSELKGRVISFGIPVFSSWRRNPITYRTGRIPIPLPGEQRQGGHCMTMVGFKDDESWPGGGYFIFRNSWGEEWGRDCEFGAGYGTLPYAFIAEHCWEAWTMKAENEKETKKEKKSSKKEERSSAWKKWIGPATAIVVAVLFLFFAPWEKNDGNETDAKINKEINNSPQQINQKIINEDKIEEFGSGNTASSLTRSDDTFDEIPQKLLAAYPFSECISVEAEKNNLPIPLVVGLIRTLTNFRPDFELAGRIGIMAVGWPQPANSFGVDNNEVLRNPCENIAVGCVLLAKYLTDNNGVVSLALIQYLKQSPAYLSMAGDERVSREVEDILYNAQMAIEQPYSQGEYTSVIRFDSGYMAYRFINHVNDKTGIILDLIEQDNMYNVHLYYTDNKQKQELVQKIKDFIKFDVGEDLAESIDENFLEQIPKIEAWKQ